MKTKFDYDVVPDIENYSAYVYRTTITFPDETSKKYIGAHKGSIYDSYDFSSEDEDYLNDLSNPENKVYKEIVMKGTEYDMFDLENQMLTEVNAKDNDEYYNKTNGGSRYTSQSAQTEAFLDSLIEKCENGEFDKYTKMVPISTVKKQMELYETIQIRTEDEAVADIEYCTPIADKIDHEHNGDTSFLPPCFAFGEWNGNKDDFQWGDGNQRYTAVRLSKRGKKIKVIILPKKEYAKIAGKSGEVTQAMIDFCYLRNPLEPAPLPMKPKELSERIFIRSNNLQDIKSDRQLRFLSKQKRFGRDAEKIISGAVTLWNNKEEAEKRGKGFHFWKPDSPEGKVILKNAKEQMEKDFPDDTVWGPYSSSTFGPSHIFGVIQIPMFEGKKYPTTIIEDCKGHRVIPVIYHSSVGAQNEWEGGKSTAVRQLLDNVAEKYNLVIGPFQYVDLIAKGVKS